MVMSVGLPRMHQEAGERRDFLPDLVRFLDEAGAAAIVLEDGYGSAMGLDEHEYLRASPRVRMGDDAECFAQDVVLVLRYPGDERVRSMGRGSVLLSMFHFPTRPERVRVLAEKGIVGVSLDAIVDVETGHRLVQNLEAVGWNGVRAAFRELRRRLPRFDDPSRRRPLHVMCLGSGAVGGYAVHAATRYGDPALRGDLMGRGVPGVEVTVVDSDLTWLEHYMLGRLERTDLLIDATQRSDPSKPVIVNDWIAYLPDEAVLLDLAADPYDFMVDPPVVKGIEGIPQGTLDHYVFPPDDPAYDAIDPRVATTHRRLALCCYSWPGLDPVSSMRVYGEQLEPVLRIVLGKPVDAWDPDSGSHEERAVARAEVSRWMTANVP
jgi:alanine dehydrogenase